MTFAQTHSHTSRAVRDRLDPLRAAQGRVVTAVDRIWYERAGNIDEREGDLQLWFDDGSVVRIRGGSDGETIEALSEGFSDPFIGPLDPETEAFVRASGAWRRVDVSARTPYVSLIGQRLLSARPLKNRFGNINGVSIIFDQDVVDVRIIADEVLVMFDENVVRRH